MLVSYDVSIGVQQSEDGEYTGAMRVYSRVVIHDDDGTASDDWVNDSYSAKIGEGTGTWLFMPSQRALLLWGKQLEFQARFKEFSWPPKNGLTGSVELRKPIYGSKILSYRVSKLGWNSAD